RSHINHMYVLVCVGLCACVCVFVCACGAQYRVSHYFPRNWMVGWQDSECVCVSVCGWMLLMLAPVEQVITRNGLSPKSNRSPSLPAFLFLFLVSSFSHLSLPRSLLLLDRLAQRRGKQHPHAEGGGGGACI